MRTIGCLFIGGEADGRWCGVESHFHFYKVEIREPVPNTIPSDEAFDTTFSYETYREEFITLGSTRYRLYVLETLSMEKAIHKLLDTYIQAKKELN